MRERWRFDGQSEEDHDELGEMFARDRESWRGDVHLDDADSWRRGAADDDARGPIEPADIEPADEVWLGAAHLPEWPEASAGPEYWMYKRMTEGA